MARGIKFGVKLQQINVGFDELAAKTRRCEEIGFDSVWLVDHLLPIGDNPVTSPILECWMTISALAARTNKIRLGTLVTCNTFRHPSLLAKMASTVDVISRGRLEFGIGAGWFKAEHDAYGIDLPKMSERAARLKEAVMIIKMMWTQEKTTFQGRYYSVKEAINNPKPLQKPHPMVWIGGQGERLMLPLIAEVGDGVNMNWLSHEEYAAKTKILSQLCEKNGRKPEDLKRSIQSYLFIAENEDKLNAWMKRVADKRGISIEELIQNNKPIYGTPERVTEQLNRFADLGVSHFMFVFPGATDTAPMELFSDKVVPSLR
ncbi:MAG: TIGR03560 family F420-dependent LLM class oxidoreductase [Thaumarchaeota archaeon]|nr:TIGR03560 family F420-dependent LLM class oxidoreductase [Nitrososphaerota archaeon]